MTSPGQALRDADYAAALWLLDADPSSALAVLRRSWRRDGIMKPIILLDCDGVLADYVTAYLQIVNTKLGFNYIPSDVKGWDIAKELRLSTLDARMVAYHSKLERFCAKINPYPWALDLYEYLKANGDVRIVTTPQHAKHWHWERLEWLYDYIGAPMESVIFAHDKTIIDGAMLIDDNVWTVVKWAVAHPGSLGIVWATPHNGGLLSHSAPQNVVRVHGLDGLKSFMSLPHRIARFEAES